jgi:hypothetical protein
VRSSGRLWPETPFNTGRRPEEAQLRKSSQKPAGAQPKPDVTTDKPAEPATAETVVHELVAPAPAAEPVNQIIDDAIRSNPKPR